MEHEEHRLLPVDMTRVTPSVLRVLPGATAAGRRGFGLAFAVFFYAYGVTMAIRGGALAGLWTAGGAAGRWDVAGIAAGWLLLYGGSVIPQLVRRWGARDTAGGRLARRYRASATAVAGFWVFLMLVCTAILAPVLVVTDPTAQESPVVTRYQAPSAAHPMGTDKFGRDVYSRVLYGARTSLSISVISVLLAVMLGLLVGVFSGYVGGRVDDVVMRIVDGLLSFPRLLFVLTLVALFSNSYLLLVFVIAATGWMGAARLVRGEILRVKKREFVQAAMATGMGGLRLVLRHLLPNAAGPVIVAATLNVGGVILLESYLSFLGLGIQPPQPSWGAMVYEGREMLLEAWWVSAFPAALIVVAVVASNLMGDGLRDAMDVRGNRASAQNA
jgi:peptide/nickel transport system permease protein